MKHGFITLSAGVPEVSVAAPTKNAESICRLIDEAYEKNAAVLTLPELSVTGYTCSDLFFSDSLIKSAERAVESIIEHTKGKKMLVFVGVPVSAYCKLYNCAAVISNGELLGLVPKTNIPNYSEFYELRHFTPAPETDSVVRFCGRDVNFGVHQIFSCAEMPSLRVSAEICEDMWVADTPSTHHAMAGATVIVNLSASNETVCKDAYRKMLVTSASGKLICAYVYADAGVGESTTDIVFSGHSMIAQNGAVTAETLPFAGEYGKSRIITSVCDLLHLEHDRRRMNTVKPEYAEKYTVTEFSLDIKETDITGIIDPRPFIPGGREDKKAVCSRITDIQAAGLAKRIRASHAKGCVVALSGGLDSTLALLVTVKAFDMLGLSHKAITTVTMPCFGTTSRTRSNAEIMALELDTSFRCIDIKEAVDIHFRDIGHDPSDLSVVYENSQARERTQIIMDIANADGSLVIGTGDLSELALGWATYNGDHMSNYGVNAGVPKTLVRHIVSYFADEAEDGGKESLARVLRDVLATPVSPELLPAKDGEIAQKTEDIVGPYDLHDFYLYHFMRWGETPDKIMREAEAAFADEFDSETIKKWLNIFLRRFYTQQFKRSALPDGPKVGSAALSPRGDWRMPSDADGSEMKI
ncbi:MAG: NAD(+) synthase [Eubacteriales bacterium]|nr:NAD(+) synthase [Eubacteriales bacterium]